MKKQQFLKLLINAYELDIDVEGATLESVNQALYDRGETDTEPLLEELLKDESEEERLKVRNMLYEHGFFKF